MKKIPVFMALCLCMAMFSGCGDDSKMNSLIDSRSSSESAEKKSGTAQESSGSDKAVDLDLTTMDGTMIYSTVYDMVTNPASYMDKTVRIKGNFSSSYDDTLKTNYFFVLVGDATACCSQGLEFIWDDNKHSFPDEYPSQDAEIQITGKYGQYEEAGNTYYYIAADDMIVL